MQKEKTGLYPLTFRPILKHKVWGGKKLNRSLHKKGEGTIGESWELSTVPNNISVIAHGAWVGKNLMQLIKTHKAKILGNHVFNTYGIHFPLLFKFIDANDALSVQLHPNDALAKKRHNSFGKTEMWYIIQADAGAKIIAGFTKNTTVPEYKKHLANNTITEILQYETAKKGDTFFIAPGTVHAIGKGILLAEIQQTSDVTYRIYDWDRPGSDGKMRELHTHLALEAINFKKTQTKIAYKQNPNTAVLLKKSAYFTTNRLQLTAHIRRDLRHQDSFVVYMCVAG
ncbi:MAG: type I phosphomannose isomerase catalytic subunit, partial [Marinirhabdus sp.]